MNAWLASIRANNDICTFSVSLVLLFYDDKFLHELNVNIQQLAAGAAAPAPSGLRSTLRIFLILLRDIQ